MGINCLSYIGDYNTTNKVAMALSNGYELCTISMWASNL